MIREITIGQYYQADSVIHKMDPRFKLIATCIYIVSLFIFKNTYVYCMALIFLLSVITMSKVPLSFVFRGMKAVIMLLMVTVIFNIFMVDGQVIWSYKALKITKEGIDNALFMGVRLTMLITGSSIMTYTTTPSQLTDGMESVLGPLKIFKVPVHEISMMMSIALRFIPILMEETDKIMKAQLARGADFESGNIIKKGKSLIPVIIPLFVSAFRRANDLAMAMEARCYRGGDGRTKMKPLIYKTRDYVGYVVIFLYLGVLIALGILSAKLPFAEGIIVGLL